MSFIILEPHADDAFLSLGGHIEKWRASNVPVSIITVFSKTRKRAEDAKAYAKAVDALWIGFPFSEDREKPEKDRKSLTRVLASTFAPFGSEAKIIAPLGIYHPEHRMLRSVVEDVMLGLPFPLLYYLDQPYASVMKNADETHAKLEGKTVASYLRPRATKYRHVKLFKDQAKFFYFNPPEKLAANIELIVKE